MKYTPGKYRTAGKVDKWNTLLLNTAGKVDK
jgi:hypothetical protein